MLAVGETKPYKSFKEQLDILHDRGLCIDNENDALNTLKHINYYRFSAYTLTLKNSYDKFYDGVSFDNVCELYNFDDELRGLVLKYTAPIEIAFRTCIAHYHSEKYGPQGYLYGNNFSEIVRHAKFLSKLDYELIHSNEKFVQHHKEDLGEIYPLWVAVEVLSFGEISKLFKNMLHEDRIAISKEYCNYANSYVENWLQCCVYARNIAAHRGRFYNRHHKANKVKLPTKLTVLFDSDTTFALIFAIHNLLPTKDLQDSFRSELLQLFDNHRFAEMRYLGFPSMWPLILQNNTRIQKD